MKICLVQYNPIYPKVSMLDAYNEVVESYQWGFAALGHDVIHRINCFDSTALNIVFGFYMPLHLGLIDTFPPNTIFFNMERCTNQLVPGTGAHYVASKYQIWDYSQSNVLRWNTLNPKYPAYYARTSYAPNLEKVPRGVEQDIDVLYYGKVSPDRFDSLQKITGVNTGSLSGLSVVTLCNIWGKQRDDFIARAKVTVNFSNGNTFEVVRVSYLMANKKAVICDYLEEIEIEPDLLHGNPQFVKSSDIQKACQTLVEDDVKRSLYAEEGYELFKQRDIRDVIKGFFG